MDSLRKSGGAPCPKCGYNGTELQAAGNDPKPWAKYYCEFCSTIFVHGIAPKADHEGKGVVEQPVRCPDCNGTKVPTNHTKRIGKVRRRHRVCADCGCRFFSTSPIDDP